MKPIHLEIAHFGALRGGVAGENIHVPPNPRSKIPIAEIIPPRFTHVLCINLDIYNLHILVWGRFMLG